jgi:phosphopantothenoylcysteine decarboxylase/phosphopantothenate--cysteine ligase
MIIAPATSSTLSKMATANSDNLLVATYLSATCPIFVFPAMDRDMYQNPANKNNIELLKSFGVKVFPSPSGELASGLNGEGRMMEPEDIHLEVSRYFNSASDFQGKKILITAGPTYEKLDPVRFIGNYSSGKMGFAIAKELSDRGALVTVVSGPVNIERPQNIEFISVESADEMLAACLSKISESDIFIGAAAVADYKPLQKSTEKIKKSGEKMQLELIKNPDLIAELSKYKKENQLFVGFALETNNEIENAQEKIKKKKLDLIILNSLSNPGAGFKLDTNQISIIDKYNKITDFELKSKTQVAVDICNYISKINASKS